jgi:hypothetical protein
MSKLDIVRMEKASDIKGEREMSDGTTHWAGCIQAGPKHYECALQEVGRLRGTIMDLRVKLEKKEWVGLTDEDKWRIEKEVTYNQFETAGEYADRVQAATEAKLKEKNGG